ncbi:hypothetical protein N403_06830 [Helicobacter pylori FD430]|nr:hypothetical protein N403_06830 [Helicobacter pylori FD430]
MFNYTINFFDFKKKKKILWCFLTIYLWSVNFCNNETIF